MLAVGMSLEETKSFLETHKILETTVCIAAVNSPTACTLSGIPDKIKSVHKMLDDAGIFNRVLHVNIAFHSHHTESIKGNFLFTLVLLCACPSFLLSLKVTLMRSSLLNTGGTT
jgi:acyl transferase domain-containing protein